MNGLQRQISTSEMGKSSNNAQWQLLSFLRPVTFANSAKLVEWKIMLFIAFSRRRKESDKPSRTGRVPEPVKQKVRVNVQQWDNEGTLQRFERLVGGKSYYRTFSFSSQLLLSYLLNIHRTPFYVMSVFLNNRFHLKTTECFIR